MTVPIDQLQRREVYQYKARLLGATADDIVRYDEIASAVGPCTPFPNTVLWDAFWLSGLHSMALGELLLPREAVMWDLRAGRVWICWIGRVPITPDEQRAYSILRDVIRQVVGGRNDSETTPDE